MTSDDDDYIYDEVTGEWRPASEIAAEAAARSEVRDASGNVLADGDSVVLIKDLKVKGAGQTLKQGTVIRSIRLTDNPEEIDCWHDAIKGLVLRTEFVRKRYTSLTSACRFGLVPVLDQLFDLRAILGRINRSALSRQPGEDGGHVGGNGAVDAEQVGRIECAETVGIPPCEQEVRRAPGLMGVALRQLQQSLECWSGPIIHSRTSIATTMPYRLLAGNRMSQAARFETGLSRACKASISRSCRDSRCDSASISGWRSAVSAAS